jgi:SAM-dependent methyltransferase
MAGAAGTGGSDGTGGMAGEPGAARTPGPAPPGWFNELAAFLGPAYLRNAFTKGTRQEVEFLVGELGLAPGMRVLDVGCGPGRHALELARRGLEVVGVDLSPEFVRLARDAAAREGLAGASFVHSDVRDLAYDAGFDAVVCLCQGGFGLLGGAEDAELVGRFARALRPGGRLALSAFSAYFAVTALEPGDAFDAATGVHHERATLRDDAGAEREFDLWTTCFTARELQLLAVGAGLEVEGVHAVGPGRYARRQPDLDHPELLLLAHRPGPVPA